MRGNGQGAWSPVDGFESAAGRHAWHKARDDLLGWSIALRMALEHDDEFLAEWLPLAARLLHQAVMLSGIPGDQFVLDLAVEECNTVLAGLGLSPQSPETYRHALGNIGLR